MAASLSNDKMVNDTDSEQTAYLQTSALLLTSCVTLNKLFNLSVTQSYFL